MDWKALIAELQLSFGMSQPEIAAVCKCGQSTISDLARGVTKDPRHSTGEALKGLLAAKRGEAAEKAVAPPAPGDGAGRSSAVAFGGGRRVVAVGVHGDGVSFFAPSRYRKVPEERSSFCFR